MIKRYQILIAGMIVILTVSAGIGSAWAYFTTYAGTEGSFTIELANHTTVTEDEPVNWVKHVTIHNDEDSAGPVYVRARAYIGSMYDSEPAQGEGWTNNADGWSYYAYPVAPGESATELDIAILNIPEADADGVEAGDIVNVAVVYECIDVKFDAEGEALPWEAADWNEAYIDSLREGAE